MANLTLSCSFTKFQRTSSVIVPRNPWSSRVSMPATTRRIHASASQEASAAFNKAGDAVKQGVKEASRAGEDLKDNVISKNNEVGLKVDSEAEKLLDSVGDLAEKAKKSAGDTWGSVLDTAENIKDTVVGNTGEATETLKEKAQAATDTIKEKAEDAKETILENVESVKSSINSKN